MVLLLALTAGLCSQMQRPSLEASPGEALAAGDSIVTTTTRNALASAVSQSQEMPHTVYLPAIMKNACSGEPRFCGPPQAQDITSEVSFGSSVSEDGKVTTIVFNDLIAALGSSMDHLVSARVVSFAFPVHSNTDVKAQLDVWGFVDRAPGTHASLIIHHAGETRLVHLPDDPEAEFRRSLITVLPAGRDYAVTLFLLTDRNSTRPGNDVVAGIDEIEVILEPFDDVVNPVYEFSGEPCLQNAISEVTFNPSLSDDGQVVTLIFNDLAASLDSSTEDLVSAGIASFAFSVQSSTDQRVRLRVEGFVDRAAGTRGVLVVHHPDGTSLLHLPADPAPGFVRNLGTTVPAGQDYRVTLFLLAERDSTGSGSDVVFGIDEIEAVLE
jgi:hypothetical protein